MFERFPRAKQLVNKLVFYDMVDDIETVHVV